MSRLAKLNTIANWVIALCAVNDLVRQFWP